MRLLTLAAAMLAALLLTIALANAQEPPEPQTATRLEPGINLVGWVGEPTSTSQLFDEIPQLESIWAWDAELDDWIVAGRDAPEWVGGLGRVRAGTGLRLVLGGEESFLWQRSTEPTSGLVELRTGWNLVAWSGADGAPIEQVAKGIGWSLRELRRWNAANQHWTTWISPERSTQLIATSAADRGATDEETEPVTVRRGEALWVNTARSVNWLQPTDILPRLVFPGGASDELQARVREDLEAVLAFFGQQYGIQADPGFTVYVAKDVDALIQAQKDDGDEIDVAGAASIRARWDRVGGWAGENVVVKQNSWPEDLSNSDISWARYVLTHEYFHILQSQLSDGLASQWLVEGTATWAEDDHQAIDGSSVWEDAREDRVSAVTESTPSLRSTESDNAAWEYTLGWLAVDRLTEAAGGGSHIEFWRRLAPTEIGPHSRWTSTPDWRTAFQETFGVSVSSFYADFDAWQRQQAMVHGSVASASDGDTRWIRGRVTDESGAPVAGVLVNAIQVEGETSVGLPRRAETNASGVFAVRAPEAGDYHLSVDSDDDCATRYHYSDGRLFRTFVGRLAPVKVAGSDVRDIELQLPSNICSRFVRGRITSDAGQPLADVSVSVCEIFYSDIPRCTSGHTASDGSFAVPAAAAGEYHLRLNLADDCNAYYSAGNVVTSSAHASKIGIFNADSPHLSIRVPKGTCAYQIRGAFTKTDGQLLADVRISACREEDSYCIMQNTDAAGSFAITVPTEDRYRLRFNSNGCGAYFAQGQLTLSRDDAELIDVAGQDVRLAPTTLRCLQINGRLVSADGAPLAGKDISACPEVGDICLTGTTDADGSFTITIPIDGRYRIHFYHWEGDVNCQAYFGQGQLTANRDAAELIDAAGQNVRLQQRQMPTRGRVCSSLISGRLVNVAGEPLARRTIHVYGSDGWSGGATTDADGRFEIPVSSDGAYHFSIHLRAPHCWRYLGRQALGSRGNPIRVSGADVTGITLRLPGTIEELCG